ncbi:MAG TPA: response regulator [Polyangiaceae bacterium]|nr:response regulator [Polyangiaceae bacterium]
MTETPAQASALNVLIVEDHADSGYVLHEFVHFMGYTSVLAESAEEALSKLESYTPHVIFLDILLPGRSGYDFAAELRRRFGDGVFLVAFTGIVGPAAESKAKEAGFDLFLTKPVGLDDVRDVLAVRAAALRLASV